MAAIPHCRLPSYHGSDHGYHEQGRLPVTEAARKQPSNQSMLSPYGFDIGRRRHDAVGSLHFMANALVLQLARAAVQPAMLRRKIALKPNHIYVGVVDLVHDVTTWFDGEYA